MDNIKPIETVYKGYRFRSRLEARWAVFFDAMGIKYLYEPQGYKMSDGTCYLPDFYLPEMQAFFEAKGELKPVDEHKIKMFIKENGKQVVMGYDDLRFTACDYYYDHEYIMERPDTSVLMKCNKCGKYYFIGINGSWECQCCGYYDGDATSVWCGKGDPDSLISCDKDEENKFMKAINKAKQARFEHGERG